MSHVNQHVKKRLTETLMLTRLLIDRLESCYELGAQQEQADVIAEQVTRLQDTARVLAHEIAGADLYDALIERQLGLR